MVFLFFLGSHCPPVFAGTGPMREQMPGSEQMAGMMAEISGKGLAMLCCGRSTPWENERPKELSLLPSPHTIRQTIPALPFWLVSTMLLDLELFARDHLIWKTPPLLIASGPQHLLGTVIKRE